MLRITLITLKFAEENKQSRNMQTFRQIRLNMRLRLISYIAVIYYDD